MKPVEVRPVRVWGTHIIGWRIRCRVCRASGTVPSQAAAMTGAAEHATFHTEPTC